MREPAGSELNSPLRGGAGWAASGGLSQPGAGDSVAPAGQPVLGFRKSDWGRNPA